MRQAILILLLLLAPTQSGCSVMKWLLSAMSSGESLGDEMAREAEIEQQKFEAKLVEEYGPYH